MLQAVSSSHAVGNSLRSFPCLAAVPNSSLYPTPCHWQMLGMKPVTLLWFLSGPLYSIFTWSCFFSITDTVFFLLLSKSDVTGVSLVMWVLAHRGRRGLWFRSCAFSFLTLCKARSVWELVFWPCMDTFMRLSSFSGVSVAAFSHLPYSSVDMALSAGHHVVAQILSAQSILDTLCPEKWKSIFSRDKVLVIFLHNSFIHLHLAK